MSVKPSSPAIRFRILSITWCSFQQGEFLWWLPPYRPQRVVTFSPL